MKKPDFFIVGAPKCATSAIYNHLSEHPQVFMSRIKEPNYFGSDLHFDERMAEHEYLELFKPAKNKKAWGEASPWYLYSKKAAVEIKQFNPEAKIIIMLRNPVDMMYSLFYENIYHGNEEVGDFETALQLEERRKQLINIPKHANPVECLFYRDLASFAVQVKRYYDEFGRSKVHIILFEEFISNPLKIWNDLLNFLSIDKTHIPQFKTINPAKQYRSRQFRNLLREPPPVIRKLYKILLPFHSLRMDVQSKMKQLNTKHLKKQPLPAQVRVALTNEFASDIKELSGLINRDLSEYLTNKSN
jgi:hypothetical protein